MGSILFIVTVRDDKSNQIAPIERKQGVMNGF
jgi:hypothetical protein